MEKLLLLMIKPSARTVENDQDRLAVKKKTNSKLSQKFPLYRKNGLKCLNKTDFNVVFMNQSVVLINAV